MASPDKGEGARLRSRFERLVRCGNLFHTLLIDGFTSFTRCPRLVPAGGEGMCWECRQPEPHPFHYPEARA